MSETEATRREFLTKSAVAAGAATVASSMPTTAEAMRRIQGANDRIHIAHVGVGVQGYGAHVRLLKEKAQANNTEQVAVCDLYGRNLTQALQHLGLTSASARYTEYRKMMERKDIDAVVVATSDNWHADVACAALESGKHVYCEKPMCKTVEEAFRMHDAVKAAKKTFQIGSQGTTDPKWHAAGELVKSGKIGQLVVAQGSYMRNTGVNKTWGPGIGGEWDTYGRYDTDAGPTAKDDAHVDWETFRKGKGPKDWDPDRFFHWRKFWDYGSGLVGDLFPHRLHPLYIAMGIPTTGIDGFPLRVTSNGGLYYQKVNPFFKDRPDREVPDFTTIQADFANSTMMAMSSTINETGWPDTVRGVKGTIYIGNDSLKVSPERVYSDEIEESNQQIPGSNENIDNHHKNWIDCIRSGKEPNGNIDLAVRVAVLIALGEMAYRHSKAYTFDPKTRKYSG